MNSVSTFFKIGFIEKEKHNKTQKEVETKQCALSGIIQKSLLIA